MLVSEELLDISPVESQEGTYIAITIHGEVIGVDTEQESIKSLYTIKGNEIDFDKQVSIILTSDSNIIAVYNTYGRFGLVIDLQFKKIVMRFNRDDYHYEQSIFPVTFYAYDNDQVLLIHGTAWNRLDISNPFTGELLTSREDPKFLMKDNTPTHDEHYLDYFHGQLFVSPNNEWIVDNGWEWHPHGSVAAWNMEQWISTNCWESEDGESKNVLWWGKEGWNDPICWLSDTTVGIVGEFDPGLYDDEELIHMQKGLLFRIFDVRDGSLLNEFKICKGNLFFDNYLYCSGEDKIFRIYDIADGKVLFEDNTMHPKVYHRKSKEFLEIRGRELDIIKLFEEERNIS